MYSIRNVDQNTIQMEQKLSGARSNLQKDGSLGEKFPYFIESKTFVSGIHSYIYAEDKYTSKVGRKVASEKIKKKFYKLIKVQ